MKQWIFALAFLPCAAFADDTVDCADAGDEVDMMECAWAKFDKLDAQLNAEYQNTIAIFEDRMAAQSHRAPDLVNRLREAQRAWVAYRDANCSMYIWAYEETHEQEPWREYCMTEMTTARLEELKRFQESGFQEQI